MSVVHTIIKRSLPQKCFLCHKLIMGTYYEDWAGHAVCRFHSLDSMVRCVSCDQFCDSHAIDVGRGEKLCAYCQKHIITRSECTYIVNFIKNIYQNSEIGEVSNWQLKVADTSTLFDMSGSTRVRGLAVQLGKNYTIYVSRNLSKVAFAGVLAHEMLHIWQYNHNIKADLLHTEGFCNLGSFVVLTTIGNIESKSVIQTLLKSPDPIYGDGFRIMKSFYDIGDWHRVIYELKNNQY